MAEDVLYTIILPALFAVFIVVQRKGVNDLRRRIAGVAAPLGLAHDPSQDRTDWFRAFHVAHRGVFHGATAEVALEHWHAGAWVLRVSARWEGLELPVLAWTSRRWPGDEDVAPFEALGDGWQVLRAGRRTWTGWLDREPEGAALRAALAGLTAGALHVRFEGPDGHVRLPLAADPAAAQAALGRLVEALRSLAALPVPGDDEDEDAS